MNAVKRIAVAALGAFILVPTTADAAGPKRPRPSDVPAAETAMAPNDFQLYNDYASPERSYSSGRAVVHFVVLGIDAPPLNDDDADGIPDYVERVGEAADRSLTYYEHCRFRPLLPDEAGPDARPDIYVSRFSPGTLGVAFPASRAEGGAFAVVSNNLDPSPERSFASISATGAHELFHLVQFSYLPRRRPGDPNVDPRATATALETGVNPELDDLVSTIQLQRWFSATELSMTTKSYGAQLVWRQLDTGHPRFLPALFTRLAARPVAGEGQHAESSTYARVAGKPLAGVFHRYAVSVAADYTDDLETARGARQAIPAPLSVRCFRVTFPTKGRSILRATFPRGRGAAATTLVSPVEHPGYPAHTRRIAPRVSDGGRTLEFTVSAGSGTSAILVLSNGGERPVPYAVRAR
jgi:hypothetical protein